MKRKSYFQCFTFDFFSMAVMKPGLLFLGLLGAVWTVYTRLNAHAEPVKSRARNSYTSRERLIHGGICLGDHKGAPGRQEELVDAPSKDELLNELSEEELEEAFYEVGLVLVVATSAPSLDEDGAKQGLPCVPSVSSSLGDLMHGVDLVFAILRTRKSGYITSTSGLRTLGVGEYLQLNHEGVPGNLFGFPTLILSGDICHRLAINKGREARELRIAALHLGTGQPLRNGVGCLVPCTLTLAGRRDKLHLLGVTTFIFGPLTLIHIVECGPAGTLAPRPGPPFPAPRPHQSRPSQAAPLASTISSFFRFPRRLDQPSAFPNAAVTSPSKLRHSATALTTPGECLGHCYLLLGDLWGIRSTGGSQVPGLNQLLGAQGRTPSSLRSGPYSLRWGGLFLETRSSVPSRLTSGAPKCRLFGSGFSCVSRGGRCGPIGTTLNSLTLSNR
ncbi:LOW QUALITY PROTEIN: hypothetical protein Cgig2_002673 [Carnegiea gigantea]|uniref:Uncharacterized protein n=1 Tax=Carnegiea gigantea TaxID=171969 RepID=A0A9Q1K216_9CARY|nr:LOW QUALITY PROTEIN: hypothetical protein Cgig2_002673 [Carnegiea gigantea]